MSDLPEKYNDQESTVVDKSKWMSEFEDIRPDLFFPEAWTKEDKEKALNEVTPSRTKTNMFSSIPMSCRGEKCVYAETCPLLAKNVAPLSKPCPIEMAMVSQFMNGLIEELNVDPNNLVEVSLVRDLVDQEVQHLRSTKLLALDDMIQENVVGLDNEGRPVLKKELHQAVELQDKILKRKKDIRNQLMATREKKASVGQGHLDSAIALSNIFHEARELEEKQEALVKRKLGLTIEDEYISADKRGREEEIVDAEIIEDETTSSGE